MNYFFWSKNYYCHLPIAKHLIGIEPELKLEPSHSIEHAVVDGFPPREAANNPDAVSAADT